MTAVPHRGRSWTSSPLARSSAALAAGYLIGGIPWSHVVARTTRRVDLREYGTGTVSGTGVYRTAGVGPLLVSGILDLLKGVAAVRIARSAPRPTAALAGGVAVTGHNWSPYLGGSGGRGIAPAMGALAAQAPEGAGVLLAGLAVGRAARQTALVSLVAYVALVPVLRRTGRPDAELAGVSVVVPMLAKRLFGNQPPRRRSAAVYVNRLLFDRDTRSRA